MKHLYLHGFGSGPSSRKAAFFRDRLRECGLDLAVPNLVPGPFAEMTLSGKLEVIDTLMEGNAEPVLSGVERSLPKPATTTERRPPSPGAGVAFIGSSMGGYLATLYAQRHPERVDRLVLLAPAFGFPTRWLERHDPREVEAWRETGFTTVYHHENDREEQIGYQLVTDAQQFPDYPTLSPDIPILILHGRNDESVPIAYSESFTKENPHARLVSYEADHSLLDVLDPIWEEISAFLALHPST